MKINILSHFTSSLKNIKSVYKTKDAMIFLVVILLYGLGYGYYRGVQDNYLAQIVHITEFQRGVVEFLRELPGLLLIFILAILYKYNEKSILKISLFIAMIAMAFLFISSTAKVPVVGAMIIFSIGEHMLMPCRSSIAMHNAEKGKEGLSLGIITSIDNVGKVFGYAIVAILFFMFPYFNIQLTSQFKSIFFLAGLVFLSAFIVALFFSKEKENRVGHIKRQRLYFKKKFTMFYILELFYGARKQIFLTFAPYVLILVYDANAGVISLLYTVCAIASVLFMPLIGKIIDKKGYKFVMVFDTILLIFVCLVYGFANRIFPMKIAFYVVTFNFVLDAIISQASIASSVYVKALSDDKNEIISTLTTGISVNHIMSIIVALLGGTIWLFAGVEFLFVFAAIFSLGNTLFALRIKEVKMKDI